MSLINDALKSYGLNDKEIIVYLACVGKNSLSAQEIADRTDLSRQVVYDHMKRLIHDGLMTTVHTGASRRYQATPPERLIQNIEHKASLIKDALPEMLKLQQSDVKHSAVELHIGTAALRNILVDALTSGKELLCMTDQAQAYELFYAHDFHNLTLKRLETRTPLKTLISSSRIPKDEIAVWKTDKKQYRETRLSAIVDGLKTTTIIYADTVVMMDMRKGSPQATVIHDAHIAETQRRLFTNLWQDAKRL